MSAVESSTQVDVASTNALITDGKAHLLDEPLAGVVPDNDERVPFSRTCWNGLRLPSD